MRLPVCFILHKFSHRFVGTRLAEHGALEDFLITIFVDVVEACIYFFPVILLMNVPQVNAGQTSIC